MSVILSIPHCAEPNSFVENAEKFTSSYKFGVYDILFLPNSFPYGGQSNVDWLKWDDAKCTGMENCCLTFATPTIIAGDKSEVDVGAHEISHVGGAGMTHI